MDWNMIDKNMDWNMNKLKVIIVMRFNFKVKINKNHA
jgi:hypothetical protein